MNLLSGRCLLFAGLLVLSTRAQEVEEKKCDDLVKPRSLDDGSVMLGRWFTVSGYTNSSVFNSILNVTDSSWIHIKQSEDGSLAMLEGNKFNESCVRTTVNITAHGNSATAKMGNITSVFSLLPSCDNCLVIQGTSTVGDLSIFSHLLTVDASSLRQEGGHIAASIYLMVNDPEVKPDLQEFKNQAACLGFTGEPDYQHDNTKAFCGDDEGIYITN